MDAFLRWLHFKVEMCFELAIHPSEVFISLSSMSKLPHWEWEAWLGGREGGPVVLVGFADAMFHEHKGNLSGFGFLYSLKSKQANKLHEQKALGSMSCTK